MTAKNVKAHIFSAACYHFETWNIIDSQLIDAKNAENPPTTKLMLCAIESGECLKNNETMIVLKTFFFKKNHVIGENTDCATTYLRCCYIEKRIICSWYAAIIRIPWDYLRFVFFGPPTYKKKTSINKLNMHNCSFLFSFRGSKMFISSNTSTKMHSQHVLLFT